MAGREGGLTATDPVQLGRVLSLGIVDGAMADLTAGAIAVSRGVATDLDLRSGRR